MAYETVDHPPHYNAHPSGIECIDIVEHLSFNIGNAIRYLWRVGLKPGADSVQEMRKAIWYIERELDRLEDSGPTGAAAKESREDIAAPGGATTEPDPFVPPGTARCPNCGHPIRVMLCGPGRQDQPSNGRAPGGAEARTPSEPTPGPATALEESAPAGGGSRPDDRPCGCEETQALLVRIDRGKALVRRSQTIPFGFREELSAILDGLR